MPATQTLELQIMDNSKDAVSGLESLAKSLSKIQNTIKGGLDFGGVSSSIQSFSDKLRRAIPNDTLKKLNSLADALREVRMAANMQIPGTPEKLMEGNPKAVANTVDNPVVQKTTEDMHEMAKDSGIVAETMETAKKEIQECQISVQEATAGIRRMIPAYNDLNKQHEQYGLMGRRYERREGMKKAADAIAEMKERTKGLEEAKARTEQLIDAEKNLGQSADLRLPKEQAEALGQAFVDNNNKASLLAMKISQLKQNLGRGIADGSLDNGQIAKTAEQIQKLQEELDKLKPRTALEQIQDGLRSIGSAARSAIKPLNDLSKQFLRIAKYRIFRSIIKEVTSAFGEGLKNVREYSKAIGGLYAKDMTALDNSLLKMKNSLGASLAVAFQQLIPIIQMFISKVIQAANVVNQFFALMSGAKTWTKAIDAVADTSEEVKKVGSAASGASKELKGLLASWDELNIIQSQSGSGGGGGLGNTLKQEEDYTRMFTEEAEFDSRIRALVEYLEQHLPAVKGLLAGIVGAILGLDGKSVLAVIGITTSFTAGESIGQNGLNSNNLYDAVAGALESAAAGAMVGWQIGGGKGALLGTFLGFTASTVITLISAISHSERNFTFEDIKALIGDAIVNAVGAGVIGFSVAGPKGALIGVLTGLTLTAVSAIVNEFSSDANFVDMFNKIADALRLALAGAGIGFVVAGAPGAFLGAIAGLTANAIINVATKINPVLEDDPVKAFEQLDQETRLRAGKFIAESVLQAPKGGFNPLGDIQNGANLIGITGLFDGIGKQFEKVKTDFDTYISTPISTFFTGLQTSINDAIDLVVKAFNNAKTTFYNNVIVPVSNAIIDVINVAINGINAAISGVNSLLNWKIDLPEWMPQEWLDGMGITGRSMSLSLGNIPTIDLIGHIKEIDTEGIDLLDPDSYTPGSYIPSFGANSDAVQDVNVTNMATDVATGTAQGVSGLETRQAETNRLLLQLLQKDFTARLVPTATVGRTAAVAAAAWQSVVGSNP